MIGIGLSIPGIGQGNGNWAVRWGLVSYWKLDEASGVYADSYGTNHLTNNNSVVAAASGKVGAGAAQLVAASGQYLSIADNASLSTGDIDEWIAGWFYADSLSATRTIAAKDTDATHREWAFYYDASIDGAEVANRLRFKTYLTGGGQAGIVSTAAAPSTGAWHFVMAYRDRTNALLAISIDGGAFVTQAETGVPADTTAGFQIGSLTATGSGFWDGRIDAVAFGKSPPLGIAALATEIRDRLYNGGNGREYPWR